MTVCNISKLVTLSIAQVKIFWDSNLDRMYKRLASGTISQTHIFQETGEKSGFLVREAVNGFNPNEYNLTKLEKNSTCVQISGMTRIMSNKEIRNEKRHG